METPVHAESFGSPAGDHNAFALALYGQLHRRGGNQFLAPFSVRTALAMAYVGARGETAAQMRAALRISIADEALHAACADLITSLNTASGPAYEMAGANSLWGQGGAPLEPAFVKLIARYYGGRLNLVDFRREAETARANMNQWVEDRTRGRIREIVPPGSPGTDTRLVLINAIYFKAMWAAPFDANRTSNEPFYLEDGDEVQAPLMHQLENVGYLKGPDYQAVKLAYGGAGLFMLVLLPDRRDGLRELETALSAPMISACLRLRGTCRVDLFLPRFQIAWGTVDLCDPLATLGMRLAFTPSRGDFSGINGREPPHEDSLFLSQLLHKAFVEVNEEGTEAAAAATAMVWLGLGPLNPAPIPVFRADHPFLFAICDQRSGAIVFLGRVVDPTRQS
jgi:serpin B